MAGGTPSGLDIEDTLPKRRASEREWTPCDAWNGMNGMKKFMVVAGVSTVCLLSLVTYVVVLGEEGRGTLFGTEKKVEQAASSSSGDDDGGNPWSKRVKEAECRIYAFEKRFATGETGHAAAVTAIQGLPGYQNMLDAHGVALTGFLKYDEETKSTVLASRHTRCQFNVTEPDGTNYTQSVMLKDEGSERTVYDTRYYDKEVTTQVFVQHYFDGSGAGVARAKPTCLAWSKTEADKASYLARANKLAEDLAAADGFEHPKVFSRVFPASAAATTRFDPLSTPGTRRRTRCGRTRASRRSRSSTRSTS